MPWIKEERLYPIIALLLILIMAVRTPLDTDMWWHLRAGEETWLNQEVYSIDTFSSTREGSNWINHSWLSQVVMYLIFRGANYYGLSIWVGVCAVLSMAFVYFQMKGHPLLRSALLIFTAVVSSVVWSPRPQIHSLVLFSLLGLLMYKFKHTRRLEWLIGIIPLFILWGNLHGGYILGFILIGAVIAGEVINKITLREEDDFLAWKQIGHLALFMLAGFLVVLINPFGVDMWKIPFNTVGVETLQNLISEWASPDFHQFIQQPMLLMLLGVFSLMGLSDKRIDGAELIPLVVFSWAALTARRNFGPFAIVAAPVFSKYLAAFMDSWLGIAKQKIEWINGILVKSSQSNRQLKPGFKNLINLMMISLLLVGVGWKIVSVNEPNFILQAERDIFPVDAVEWLKDSGITGKMFNEYNWGGYLTWHLRDKQVFVDGRTDLYGDDILEDYVNLIAGKTNWDEVIDKYNFRLMLIKPDSVLVDLIENSELKVVYRDTQSVIIIK